MDLRGGPEDGPAPEGRLCCTGFLKKDGLEASGVCWGCAEWERKGLGRGGILLGRGVGDPREDELAACPDWAEGEGGAGVVAD